MRWRSVGTVVIMLVLMALPAQAQRPVEFSGGYATCFTLQDDGSFSTASVPLGVTYRPEVEGGGMSPIMFWDNQIFRDGAPDLNMCGVAYSIYKWKTGGIELIGEGAIIFKNAGDSLAKIGAYGGVRIPFSAGKDFRITVGGGYDGDDPILIVGASFAG